MSLSRPDDKVYPGTLITQFIGRPEFASKLSNLTTSYLLDMHSLRQKSLGSVWILAFAILRMLSENMDHAFSLLEPIGGNQVSDS